MKHAGNALTLLAALAIPAGGVAQQPTYKREVPDSLVAKAKVSEDSARAVALRRVPNGTVASLELERERGHLIYSWDITVAGKPGITEVHVSAMTGKVLRVEHENTTARKAARRSS